MLLVRSIFFNAQCSTVLMCIINFPNNKNYNKLLQDLNKSLFLDII